MESLGFARFSRFCLFIPCPGKTPPLASFLLCVGATMTSDDTADPPASPAFAAQPRAVRLHAKPVVPEEQVRPQEEEIVVQPVVNSLLEKKLAGLHDAQDLLRVLDSELLMQRTARLYGNAGKARQALRVLSVSVLFALLIAALAAMGWLQGHLAQTGISRHRTEMRAQR